MTLRQTIEQHFDTRLDQATEEVFGMMLGAPCAASAPAHEPVMISALIGLAGVISGSCILEAGQTAAGRIAALLTGTAEGDDDRVGDALGEICNMVAGAWKSSIPELASGCMLSPPTIITGSSYRLHPQPARLQIERHYRVEDAGFSFLLHCIPAE